MNKPLIALSGLALTLTLGVGAGWSAANLATPGLASPLEDDLIQGLALNPSQHALWQEIDAAKGANLRLVKARMKEVRHLLEEELQFETPNLARVSARSEQVVDEVLTQVRANRDRRLALYETLEPSQKSRVRGALETALVRWDRARDALLLLIGGPSA